MQLNKEKIVEFDKIVIFCLFLPDILFLFVDL